MRSPQLAHLRFTLLAALGLGAGACGSSVDTPAGPSGTGGSGAGTSSGPGSGGGSAVCDGAVPVPASDGSDSGYMRCPDGTIHRVAALACNTSAPACGGTEDQINCQSDAECAEAPNGRCASGTGVDFGGDYSYCGCVYPCETDTDCGAGLVCVCPGVVETGAPWSTCQAAVCATGADCDSGECGISSFNDGCGEIVQLACRDESDACRLDTECGATESCTTYGDFEWNCWGSNCAIGRPLLVDGMARTAASASRDDWSAAALRPQTEGLGPELRAALAAHWSDVAALEHASIGSFARFSLQLMALGAPSDLLADAQRAALDEIEHARIAYALASTYADGALGPGALAAAAAPIATDLAEVLVALVEEACVGETVGVAEAAYLASVIADPVLARVHHRIATDETRHAALAWRVLRWGLERADEATRRLVRQAFDDAVEKMARPLPQRAVVSRDHGVLSSRELQEVRLQAVRQVVIPCSRALTGELCA